jgi:F-type H+-transporting ATPase subunit epsilon
MATKEIELSILTPQQNVFSGLVRSLVVPAYEGYLGVLTEHAPFICLLKNGRITARADDTKQSPAESGVNSVPTQGVGKSYQFSISGGLMEVLANKVSILADSAESVITA